MRHTVSGLVSRPIDAQRIIQDLTASCSCDRGDISILAGESAGEVSASASRGLQSGAHAAMTAGGAMVEALKAVLGAASRVTQPNSSLGALSAVGDVAAAISRATLNTIADLSQALVDFGVQEELAHRYAEALRQGGILVIVRAESEQAAECARGVLANNGVDASGGWAGGASAHGAGVSPSR